MSISYHFRLAFNADPFEVRTACVTAVVAKTDPSTPIPFVRSSLVVTRRSFADLSHITFLWSQLSFESELASGLVYRSQQVISRIALGA